MHCSIVKDLIPLYIDKCCSKETEQIVEEHIRNCKECKKLLEDMKSPSNIVTVSESPKTLRKLNDWKASVLQSVLLFLSFGLLTIGVTLEAQTPSGPANGFWAINLIVPATGFMLSLANWYFVKLYKSRKSFSNLSFIAALMITLCGYIWSGFHYQVLISNLFAKNNLADFLYAFLLLGGIGLLLTAVFSVLSKVLSNLYARMLGKE